jgi:hypothetical protein
LIEAGDYFHEHFSIVLDEFLEWCVSENILQQRVVHDEVIELDSLLFSFLPLKLEGSLISVELLLPLLLEHLPAEERFPEGADVSVEHVGVSSLLEGFIDFAHVPLEGLLVEVGHVSGDEFLEDLRDLGYLFLLVLEVEFEGTESDSAVVERHNRNRPFVVLGNWWF